MYALYHYHLAVKQKKTYKNILFLLQIHYFLGSWYSGFFARISSQWCTVNSQIMLAGVLASLLGVLRSGVPRMLKLR